MGLFSRTNKSKKVSSRCAICEKPITYLLVPRDHEENTECFRFADIKLVKACNQCACLVHTRCQSEERKRLGETENVPTLGEALRQIGSSSQGFMQTLEASTKGLECPACGSFSFTDAYQTDDDKPIRLRTGKRID